MKEKDFLSAQEKSIIILRNTIEDTMYALMNLPVRTVLEPIDTSNYCTFLKPEEKTGTELLLCSSLAHTLGMPDGLDGSFTFGDCSSVMDTGKHGRVRTPYIDEKGFSVETLSAVSQILRCLAVYRIVLVKNDTLGKKKPPAASSQETVSDKALRQKQQHEFYESLMSQLTSSSTPRSILDMFFKIKIKDYQEFLDTLPFFKLLPKGARDLFGDMKRIAEQDYYNVTDNLTVEAMFHIALANVRNSSDVVRELLLAPLFALKYRNRYDYS